MYISGSCIVYIQIVQKRVEVDPNVCYLGITILVGDRGGCCDASTSTWCVCITLKVGYTRAMHSVQRSYTKYSNPVARARLYASVCCCGCSMCSVHHGHADEQRIQMLNDSNDAR